MTGKPRIPPPYTIWEKNHESTALARSGGAASPRRAGPRTGRRRHPAGRHAAAPAPAADPWAALAPVSVSYAKPLGGEVKGNFLSYNDFHGAIDPPAGSGATVNGTPAGGVEFLATWLKKLRAEAKAEGGPAPPSALAT